MNKFKLTPKDNNLKNVCWTKSIDQHKANIATKYIGFGIEGTSTYNYYKDAIQANIPTNVTEYDNNDYVFVSINGGNNLKDENFEKTLLLCMIAIKRGAKLIMDTSENRMDEYNIGERKLYDTILRSVLISCVDYDKYSIIRMR